MIVASERMYLVSLVVLESRLWGASPPSRPWAAMMLIWPPSGRGLSVRC
jgi:hypothetical protein